MTTSDAIRPAPRPRGVLRPDQVRHLEKLRGDLDRAQAEYRRAVVVALSLGSFSEVSKTTGLSKDTLQRWKREAGR